MPDPYLCIAAMLRHKTAQRTLQANIRGGSLLNSLGGNPPPSISPESPSIQPVMSFRENRHRVNINMYAREGNEENTIKMESEVSPEEPTASEQDPQYTYKTFRKYAARRTLHGATFDQIKAANQVETSCYSRLRFHFFL